MTTDFQIAIPTYNRPEIIQKAALSYLTRSKFPPERVTIWISGEAQRALYDGLPGIWQDRMRISVKGLMANRRYAEAQYPEGTHLLWLNDDIFGVDQLCPDDMTLNEVPVQLIAERGFKTCATVRAFLWGIYAVHNSFYMSRNVHADLRYLTGCFYGVVLRHENFLQPTYGDAKEDYERALRFYTRDGRIVRFDEFAPRTIYYNSVEIFPNRGTVEANIQCLEEMWPEYVRRNTRRSKGPWPEILIADRGRRAAVA